MWTLVGQATAFAQQRAGRRRRRTPGRPAGIALDVAIARAGSARRVHVGDRVEEVEQVAVRHTHHEDEQPWRRPSARNAAGSFAIVS